MPVHFLDLASAVEKLRWAEKEWRELDRDVAESEADSSRGNHQRAPRTLNTSEDEDEESPIDLDRRAVSATGGSH